MKKSKILIPAFVVLALSVGASVTGTVAWFTASRSATFTSTFSTTDLGGNLVINNVAKIGTSVNTSGSIEVKDSLYHGSYNAKANKEGELYVASTNDVDNTVVGYVSKGTAASAETNGAPTDTTISSKWYAGTKESKKAWYAVSWEMNVKLSNPQANSKNYLFLSFENSKFADSVPAGNTIQGLRIALMTTEYCTVIGGNGTESHVVKAGNFATPEEQKTFVGNFAHYGKHGADNAIKEAVDAEEAKLKENKGCLGVIDNANGVDVYAVAWYEGEDESVVSTSTMSDVTATLKLYSRTAI